MSEPVTIGRKQVEGAAKRPLDLPTLAGGTRPC